jgi:hypothetical protein
MSVLFHSVSKFDQIVSTSYVFWFVIDVYGLYTLMSVSDIIHVNYSLKLAILWRQNFY